MPNRILREGINESERVDRLTCGAELFYRRAMSAVDDHGRYYAKAELLLAALFPLRIGKLQPAEIDSWLEECQRERLMAVYEIEGKRYLEVLNFRQQVRAKISKFPPPPDAQLSLIGGADAMPMRSNRAADAHLGGGGGGDVVEGGDGGGEGRASCPVDKIVELYHEVLPGHPRCVAVNDARKRHIRARWNDWREQGKYLAVDEGLAWWRRFFAYVGESAFLTGRAPPRPGRDPFVADVDFLFGAEKNVQILEGKYHDGVAA